MCICDLFNYELFKSILRKWCTIQPYAELYLWDRTSIFWYLRIVLIIISLSHAVPYQVQTSEVKVGCCSRARSSHSLASLVAFALRFGWVDFGLKKLVSYRLPFIPFFLSLTSFPFFIFLSFGWKTMWLETSNYRMWDWTSDFRFSDHVVTEWLHNLVGST